MPDPIPSEEFQHHHRDAMKSLEILRLQRDDPDAPEDDEPKPTPAQGALKTDIQAFVDGVVSDLGGAADPKIVLEKGLKWLGEVEGKRFVIQNLLEAVKNGKPLGRMIAEYKKLGLSAVESPDPSSNETAPAAHDGRALRSILGRLKRLALVLMQLVVNALKAIPRLCAIKPSIGLVGAFPSLSFELEAESMTVQELFEVLFANL